MSGRLTAVPPVTFKTTAEYEQWSAEFGAGMAQYSAVLDLKVLESVTSNTLMASLRIYPLYNPHFYFLDDSGTHRNVTNFHIYPYKYLLRGRNYAEFSLDAVAMISACSFLPSCTVRA